MSFYRGTENLTEVSAKQWDYITQENLTAREAVAFLYSGMQTRTFRDVLRQVCPDAEQSDRLTEGLCAINPDAQPDSIRRKVQNWMGGKALPTQREDVFQICFALGLDLEQSDRMLGLLTDQGIHYRNVGEMIYAYCLRFHLPYAYAHGLRQQLERKPEEDNSGYPVTRVIQQEFQSVQAEEDLFSFIARHRDKLGTQHNTAYTYFCRMLGLLTGEALEGEQTYSMEYVAEEYLRLNVPKDKNTARYTDVQKLVKNTGPAPGA